MGNRIHFRTGIKTDIYMLAQCINKILSEILPETTPDISLFVRGFLERAMSSDYETRPDSDEFLKFFTILNNFFKINKDNFDEKNKYAAKLALFYADKWNVAHSNENPKTWGELCAFDDFNPLTNEQHTLIRYLATYACNVDWLKIITNHALSISICILEKANHVSKEIIELLAENPEACHTINNSCPDIAIYSRLSNLGDSLAQQRKLAIAFISEELNQAKTTAAVANIMSELKYQAEKGKINYLYKRQGIIKFSIYNHICDEKEVSGTWVNIMEMIARRKKDLQYELVTIDDFKNAFYADYEATPFGLSTMKNKLEDKSFTNRIYYMSQVIEYAKKYPNTRTARILNQLAEGKSSCDEMDKVYENITTIEI